MLANIRTKPAPSHRADGAVDDRADGAAHERADAPDAEVLPGRLLRPEDRAIGASFFFPCVRLRPSV